MRTKITILSAVALAAGLLSASAQVYSANVVGYYNVTLPGLKSTLITDQLPGGGTNTALNNQFLNFDDQEAADGAVLNIWNGATFATYTYVSPGNGGPAWADQGGEATTVSLPLGDSAFLQNPSAATRTLTFVGEVVQGALAYNSKAGSYFRAYMTPVGTTNESPIINMDAGATDGDVLFNWNPLAGASGAFDALYTFVSAENGGPAWANQGGEQAYPAFSVGQGYFYQHLGGTSNWVVNFTVQ